LSSRKVGIIGARGIRNYGGYETVVSEIASRLVQNNVDVYCSCEYAPEINRPTDYKGAHLLYFPVKPPENYSLRKLYEFFYDIYFASKFSALCDIVYVLGVSAGPITIMITRLMKKRAIINVDGLEWKRNKFSLFEKIILFIFFHISAMSANATIIDNTQLQRHLLGLRKIIYIPYGASSDTIPTWDTALLKNLFGSTITDKLSKSAYWLVIARLEPENNIHLIVDAFRQTDTKYPLVFVGSFTSNKYRNLILEKIQNANNIIMLGGIYNFNLMEMIRKYCFAYIHGHSVGGTNPSLLESMNMKNTILAHDNEFNREVCGSGALFWKNSEELKNLIELTEKGKITTTPIQNVAFDRVQKEYAWDRVIEKYLELFKS